MQRLRRGDYPPSADEQDRVAELEWPPYLSFFSNVGTSLKTKILVQILHFRRRGVDRIHVNKVLGAIVLDLYGIDRGGHCLT
jgi:hypothetical protein